MSWEIEKKNTKFFFDFFLLLEPRYAVFFDIQAPNSQSQYRKLLFAHSVICESQVVPAPRPFPASNVPAMQTPPPAHVPLSVPLTAEEALFHLQQQQNQTVAPAVQAAAVQAPVPAAAIQAPQVAAVPVAAVPVAPIPAAAVQAAAIQAPVQAVDVHQEEELAGLCKVDTMSAAMRLQNQLLFGGWTSVSNALGYFKFRTRICPECWNNSCFMWRLRESQSSPTGACGGCGKSFCLICLKEGCTGCKKYAKEQVVFKHESFE